MSSLPTFKLVWSLTLCLLHAGTVFHRNILNQATFCQRVELGDQDSKGQTSLVKTTTLFGIETMKHKFVILAEKAKKSGDISMQELEERQACKRRLTAEGAALGGLVKGYLKALSSASDGRGWT